MTALIARCPGCQTTAEVVEAREFWTGDRIQIFAAHGECRGGKEAGEVLEDTPTNREALAMKWAGEKVCPECLQRPVRARGLCTRCGSENVVRFQYRRPVRRRSFGGRR